jgi:hypothetical protein
MAKNAAIRGNNFLIFTPTIHNFGGIYRFINSLDNSFYNYLIYASMKA